MRETIQLYKSNKKPGTKMLREHYDSVAQCIFQTLKHQNGTIYLTDLIEIVKNKVTMITITILPWYLLQVKADLESRKLIKICKDYHLQQIITTTPGILKKIDRDFLPLIK